MTMLFGLTDYDEVMAQLGVDDVEFSEEQFRKVGIEQELKLDLLQWFPNYEALNSDNSTDSNVVAQQLALRIYAKVFSAHMIAITAPLRFFQQINDGQNTSKRFQNESSLRDFIQELEDKKFNLRNTVLSYSTSHSPQEKKLANNFVGMKAAPPATDIITGR